MKKKSYIYCFTNKINNKKYIGSTVSSPNKRYNQHIYNAFHPETEKYNYPLYSAIRKYGINNFNFSILIEMECDEKDIRLIEKTFIEKFNTISPNGYNQTNETLHPSSDPIINKKISETKRNNSKQVAELDKNNSIQQIWRSVADCAEDLKLNEKHIADCCRGERKTTGNKRFCWIDENGILLLPNYNRNSYKGKSGTTQIQISSKKINKIDKDSNKIIATYDTIALAARDNNCDASAIVKVCKGKRQTCGGYKWQYSDET